MEPRLQRRYLKVLESHMRAAPELAAGVARLPGVSSGFAATQAAWRFLNNDRVDPAALAEPLRAAGRAGAAGSSAGFVLLVHDWCKVAYPTGKRDAVRLTHAADVGYELTTALLVSADDGRPLAPMELHVKTGRGVVSTRTPAPANRAHLEQVGPTMAAVATWGLDRPVVHVIDREADSVGHYRRWHAAGHWFLVRADDRRVRWQGRPALLTEIAREFSATAGFRRAGSARYRGRDVDLWVAEAEVVLTRPAKRNRRGVRSTKAGPPLPLRFVGAQVRAADGTVLAHWFLLSNVPPTVAGTVLLAHCYYWRWRIESFFKLLKGHGQQLERWQQETGPAVARRMLVAAMACVVVWQLQHATGPDAAAINDLLVMLSGRQTKRARPHTAPALLAGLWILLSMLAVLDHYDLKDLKRMAKRIP